MTERMGAKISPAARPPIMLSELDHCRDANCPQHGRIHDPADKEGEVFFCGVGQQYWRYSRESGMYGRLNYSKLGIV